MIFWLIFYLGESGQGGWEVEGELGKKGRAGWCGAGCGLVGSVGRGGGG